LEANPAAVKSSKKWKAAGKESAWFRNTTMKNLDDMEYASELSEKDDLANMIEENYKRMKKKFKGGSSNWDDSVQLGMPPLPNDQPNIFTGNWFQYNRDQEEALKKAPKI